MPMCCNEMKLRFAPSSRNSFLGMKIRFTEKSKEDLGIENWPQWADDLRRIPGHIIEVIALSIGAFISGGA